MPTPTDSLLRYRPWKGTFRPPIFAAFAMARASVVLLLRRKLFWGVYALAGLVFFAFFYGQYFVNWAQRAAGGTRLSLFGLTIRAEEIRALFDALNASGTAHTFANFIWYQGHVALIALPLAGALLVGNDFHHGSLPFYLSKPIGRRHYVLGKVLGVGAVVNLLATLPAVLLWGQAGLLQGWQTYYVERFHLLLGILGYGAVLTVLLSLLLVAAAVMARRTVPLVMGWGGVFALLPPLTEFLADGRRMGVWWKLLDLWNDAYLVGLWMLRSAPLPPNGKGEQAGANEPPVWMAAAVLAAVSAACWVYLQRRVRGGEVVP